MKITKKRFGIALIASLITIPWGLAVHPAEAGIGGGIGITFPAGHHGGTRLQRTSYAGVRVHDVSEELTVEEKGGWLLLKLKVHNEGESLYMVEHPTGQDYDFALLDAKGKEIWRWSNTMAFTQAFQTFAIEPGASQEFTVEIDRKTYRELRDKAVLAVAGLTDTGIYVSAEVPDTVSGGTRGASITGGIIFGSGAWSRW